MARKIIDIGIVGNDGTGDSIRDSFRKVNDNFRELYSSLGLGDNLTFRGLDDTPESYSGQENSVVTVNNTETGVTFKQLVPGSGIQIDFTANENEIKISSQFSEVVADPSPQLGGDLSTQSGSEQWRIVDMGSTESPLSPIYEHEAINKRYADSKIARAGVDAIDPRTGVTNPSFGTMSGPLILSRDPEPEDDETYNGLIAATKRYVDNSAFGSSVNLYVATSGEDYRPGVSDSLQGRALAYAYKSFEAALKKAEELILDAQVEIGPYKKVLTYNNGEGNCTLSEIGIAPSSGSGFSGLVLMSVDSVEISSPGVNYMPGDIITLAGGTYIEPARYEVLTTSASPGGVVTIRQLSSGVYTTLPGSTDVDTTSDSSISHLTEPERVHFNVTYKVNNVQVLDGGSGYGLVSVRIVGGGGAGAFGTADVSGGVVQSITITDQGTGFTSEPNVLVNLPRFLIYTNGYRTDFTGDVLTDTPTAVRGRDVREGLYLRGETSGALAQILSHQGDLDSEGNEIFDVDIKYGSFEIGEVISYGDVSKRTQITILAESGEYYENFPLRIPQNVSIVGDEFRRVIIRPKDGISTSPWVGLKFRRDLTVGQGSTVRADYDPINDTWASVTTTGDLINIADRLYGYHYLTDSADPLYPTINNKGYFRSTSELLLLNKQFLQKEVVAWIDNQIENNVSPFDTEFAYNSNLCERDVGLLVDAMAFDLKYGGSRRTVSAALKYYTNASSLIAITDQLSQTDAAIRRLGALAQMVIRNVSITELFQTSYSQTIDGAYIAETGSGGTSFNISNASNLDPVVITTETFHGLSDGDQIIIADVGGMTEINGNDYYVKVVDTSSFELYNDSALTDSVDGSVFETYTSGGYASNTGGVIGALINVVLDIINESGDGLGVINTPKNNNELDVFLCNDAVRLQAITCQGHGGFMMVLDPEGQILSKSPYAQECASFSKSTGRQTFAGGMFVDGFTGNLKFTILSKDSNTFLRVGGLDRMPQLPASFIVNDQIYRINYVRDWTFNVAGSTASLVLDENTPWTFDLFEYNSDICYRDVGLIIDGLAWDIVLGTNYHARQAGLSYRQANAEVVITDQQDLTARSIVYAHNLASSLVSSTTEAQVVVDSSSTTIETIVRNGTTFAPTLSLTSPTGLSTNVINAKSLLQANIDFIVDETIGWIDAQISAGLAPFTVSFEYNSTKCARDTRYIIEAVLYDLVYGGNSQTRYAALKYYDGVGDLETLQLGTGEEDETVAAIAYVSYLAEQVVQDLAPASTYSSTPRVSGTPGTSAEAATIAALTSIITDVISGGTSAAPTEVLPDLEGSLTYSSALKAARELLLDQKINIQDSTISFVAENANTYEILMPGNRSMLGNDYTQINDMGYGIIATNGGLIEAVSMFTYYCHISYYSINGGQIRSVGGSSSHGNYALVAEGADPLEVPTPVTLYYDLAQGVDCYYPSGTYANSVGGLLIYINNYDYEPLENSELEVDHGLGAIYRYPVTGVSTSGLPSGVVRLTLRSSAGTGIDGLAAVVPDGTKMTLRQNSQVVLTGDVIDVAVRPSTGLVLAESPDVYRILQFAAYEDPVGPRSISISASSPAVFTKSNHGLLPGYHINFTSDGVLPAGLSVDSTYFVLADGWTENSFYVSTTKTGSPITTTDAGSGTHYYSLYGLARTTMRENYNYVDCTVYSQQPYSAGSETCTITIANPGVVTLIGHGFSEDDTIRFETDGDLPAGLSADRHYFVHTVLSADEFTVKDVALPSVDVDPIETTGTQSGTHTVGLVSGAIGDSTIAIVALGDSEATRVLGTQIVWKGETYTVTSYQNELETGTTYALLTFDTPLVDSVVYFNSVPTLKGAVAKGEAGTLTIRISLTRVTSHDLLEIGTGSYADTNYPNEIYGAAVNALQPGQEAFERTVGRVFYVTTDQFGNFSVGPYFRVDQGTGTVTFAASIALSNLDGIGFKRGVPVSEFSTDSAMADNATDTVPTENAVRGYVERRLGLSHTGNVIPPGSLIPTISGGFMALDGQLAMKADMDMDDHKIINVADPTNSLDAVNLQSLTFDNFNDTSVTEPMSGDLLVFTGDQNSSINATVIGDLSLELRSGIDSALNNVYVSIKDDIITNTQISASAGIEQSKLVLNSASTRANATGITQADKGIASFDSTQFDATTGWITIKDNGISVAKLAQIATKTVLGNSSLVTGNVSTVGFSTIVDSGGAIKKSQYNSGTGYLRRVGFTSTNDSDYTIVDESSSNVVSTLVKRDSNGDFAARNVNLQQLLVDSKTILDTTTSATGGYTQLYGFSGQVGILIGDGSTATDKRSFYDNDGHVFRSQNGLSGGSLTAGSIQLTAITTGGSSTAGTITGNWSLTSGSRMQATYADLAEYYEGDKDYEVGTVLVFGGDKEVTLSTTKQDYRVAGVVSDNAAYTMNSECKGSKVLIALQGRVPCKVVGKIKKGDLLVTSNIAGVAVSAGSNTMPGTIIGKALENFESDHIGTIEVAVGRT